MNRLLSIFMLMGTVLPTCAQTALTLDSCRTMALRNNKQLNVARLQQDVAKNTRKALRTKYLPKVDAIGGYELFEKEISLLSDQQKTEFANMGTIVGQKLQSKMPATIMALMQQNLITPQMVQQFGKIMGIVTPALVNAGNSIGNSIKEAFETNTHQIWTGAVMVRQPLYMGGGIIAANNIANIAEQMATNNTQLQAQNIVYNIDHTYWLLVSLKRKHLLATNYCALVSKLLTDVRNMLKEGVATRADTLKLAVKLNEAEMTLTKVEDGMTLAKMLLCQLCGLPLNQNITLADENKDNLSTSYIEPNRDWDVSKSRPELRLLQNAIDISKERTHLIKALYLPHVMLTGGYLVSNPNMYNGYQRKFCGTWNVGIVLQIPVWNWGEGTYKIRASKTATNMAQLTMNDVQEKIDLQIAQCKFKISEAQHKLVSATKNIKSAEENLRCATLGFKEGVINSTDVMAAQTAWQQAQSQKIDAEIEVKLAQVDLQKALGILQ